MIVNLIGPPAAGKSTFASRFVLEHPYFTYMSIDEYRLTYRDEALAWHHILKDIVRHPNVIFESCGLSWRLREVLKHPNIRNRKIFTVCLTADRKTLQDRLQSRQKRLPNLLASDAKLEFEALDWSLQHEKASPVPINIKLHVGTHSVEDTYEQVSEYILRARILEETKGQDTQI